MFRINRLVYRLLTGIVYYNQYKFVPPSIDLLYEAELFYDELFEERKFDSEWIRSENLADYLKDMGYWTEEDQNNMEILSDNIDDLKLDTYKEYKAKGKWGIYKQMTEAALHKYNGELVRKHQHDHCTLEKNLERMQNEFIVLRSCYKNGRQISDKESSPALQAYNVSRISPSKMREVARSQEWLSYWCINQEQCFDTPPRLLSAEQRAMIQICKMFDNSYQHPDCPDDEEVFNDPILFDGWMIECRRKRKAERRKSKMKQAPGKGQTMNFVVASDAKEAREIYDMNSPQAAQQVKGLLGKNE